MKAIRVEEQGGPEVMVYQDFELPNPGPDQVQVKLEAIGVNFRDLYQRSGEYPMNLPYTPGTEGAGTVTAVGQEVNGFGVGDRVGYYGALGAYAEMSNVAARRVIKLPDDCSFERAAAVMGQGTTAHYLVHSCYPLQAGETCLVHAAAGGLGLLMVQMAKRIGARVIGTTSTETKAEVAKAVGCDDVIIYTEQDFEAEVKRITDGVGVHVVYDSVGKTTFDQSLRCLRRRGYMVLCGQSAGPVPPFNPRVLNSLGSLYLTRPSGIDYSATREEMEWRLNDVLGWVASGELKVTIDSVTPLAEAAQTHIRLASRGTVGKLLLRP